jgi:hypothetical protein
MFRNMIFEFFIQRRTLFDLCLMTLTSFQFSVEASKLPLTRSPHHVSSPWHVVGMPSKDPFRCSGS